MITKCHGGPGQGRVVRNLIKDIYLDTQRNLNTDYQLDNSVSVKFLEFYYAVVR